MNAPASKPLDFDERRMFELIERAISRCVRDLPDFRDLPIDVLGDDLAPMIRWHTDFIITSAAREMPVGHEVFRNSAVRRFHQGIPVQAVIESYQIWGEELWKALISEESMSDPAFSLHLAALISGHVELSRSAVTSVYLEESTGRGAARQPLRPDLLDALISTDVSDDFVARLLVTLQIEIAAPHALLLLRPRDGAVMAQQELMLALLEARRALEETGVLIAANGIRRDDIVLICALRDWPLAELISTADRIATESPDLLVGMSDVLVGPGGFASGFREAVNAITYTPGLAERRAYTAQDAMINRILRHSEFVDHLRGVTIDPLVHYDKSHHSELLLTLHTFIESHFNTKVTATHLHLQPNTVRYRLRRIHEITGSDPYSSHGILALMAGLRSIRPR